MPHRDSTCKECNQNFRNGNMMKKNISNNSVIVDSSLGKGTKVWHYTNLYGCKIGDNCNIGSYTEIQNDVVIGDNVTISSHSFICSLVSIEDNVFIGHGVTTINDIYPPSYKNSGSKNHWKGTVIKKGAVIGSNATLFPVTIGKNSVIGAGSVVLNDVPDNCVVAGNPAKMINKNESNNR